MHKSRHERLVAPTLLGATALTAAGAFFWLSRAIARRETRTADETIHRKLTPPPAHPLRAAGEVLGPMGKWYTYIPAALAVASSIVTRSEPRLRRTRHRRNRRRGAASVAASGLVSFALTEVFDRILPQPPSPPGHPKGKPVFPSGHTFGPLAVGLASSYVLGRERLISPIVTVPAALTLPLVSAATRVVEEKHWGSDVAGGVLGGVAVAGAILAAYELMRDT